MCPPRQGRRRVSVTVRRSRDLPLTALLILSRSSNVSLLRPCRGDLLRAHAFHGFRVAEPTLHPWLQSFAPFGAICSGRTLSTGCASPSRRSTRGYSPSPLPGRGKDERFLPRVSRRRADAPPVATVLRPCRGEEKTNASFHGFRVAEPTLHPWLQSFAPFGARRPDQ